MTRADRSVEFFVVEASEYLAVSGQLVASADSPPDGDRLMRVCRALRGSALMAGLGTFARAAAALEVAARRIRDHEAGWDRAEQERWSASLAELALLTGRVRVWGDAEDRAALALASSIEGSSGPVVNQEPRRASGLTPGVRAFIARESAAIAGSWQEAARALAPTPPPAALNAVLERMRSLRGLDAAAASLSPLPELLEAMEVTARGLLGHGIANPDVADLFSDAADALQQMAKSVSDIGQVVVPDGLELIANRLLDQGTGEADVIPIARLAPEGEASIVSRGEVPSTSGAPVSIELVGVGDHLIAQADVLSRATSPVTAALRLYILHATMAAMPVRSPTGRFLSPLTGAIIDAIGTPGAVREPDAIAAMLRVCGEFLVEAGEISDQSALIEQRDSLYRKLTPDGADVVPIEALAPGEVVDDSSDVVPIESLAPVSVDSAGEEIVPIASLAPDDSAVEIVAIESLAPSDEFVDDPIVPIESLLLTEPVYPADFNIPDVAPGNPGRLESAFRRLALVRDSAEPEAPSIAGLIGDPVVAITSLCYRGPTAVNRAAELRHELRAALGNPATTVESLRPLLDELLDLIELARDAA